MSYTETTTETTTEPIEQIDTFEKVKIAAAAAEDKKAADVTVLKLIGVTTFTDYFVICSANSSRQVQSISGEIEDALRAKKVRPLHIEGYSNAEWVLMDYGTFIVHVFNEKSRQFYDLERLWRDAEKVELNEGSVGS
jgi:ribosome-associated protein